MTKSDKVYGFQHSTTSIRRLHVSRAGGLSGKFNFFDEYSGFRKYWVFYYLSDCCGSTAITVEAVYWFEHKNCWAL